MKSVYHRKVGVMGKKYGVGLVIGRVTRSARVDTQRSVFEKSLNLTEFHVESYVKRYHDRENRMLFPLRAKEKSTEFVPELGV